MRAILSALLSLVLGFVFSANAFAFDGPSIPQNIPFTKNGTTYTAYVQTWHPWYNQSSICYYAENFNQTYAPVFNTDGIPIFGWVNTAVILNPASFNQSWDDEEHFNSTDVLCGFTFQQNSWIDLDAPPWRPYRGQYTWADWYYWDDDGRQNYILKEDLVRAVGIDVKINVTFDFNGQFGLGAYTAGDVVIAGGPPVSPWNYPVTPYDPGSYDGRSFFYDNNHLGEDEAQPEGAPVHAIGPGKVVWYKQAAGYGELVAVVEHTLNTTYSFKNAYGSKVKTKKILSIYGHIRSCDQRQAPMTCTNLSVGDPIDSNTIIGYINDDTHNGDGTEHLHLGIRLSSAAVAKQKDPGKWFRGYEGDTTFGTDFTAASTAIQILRGE